MSKLTDKQSRFVDEYLVDLNATKAAIRSGYKKDYADRMGHKLVENSRVSEAIQQRMKEREKRTEVTADMVIRQLAKIAFADIKDFVEWDGKDIRIRPSDEIDGTLLSELSEGVSDAGRIIKIKRYDAMKALELLGKHLGAFTEKLEVSGQVKQIHEQQTHIIQELISDEHVANRIRDRFRRDLVSGTRQGQSPVLP